VRARPPKVTMQGVRRSLHLPARPPPRSARRSSPRSRPTDGSRRRCPRAGAARGGVSHLTSRRSMKEFRCAVWCRFTESDSGGLGRLPSRPLSPRIQPPWSQAIHMPTLPGSPPTHPGLHPAPARVRAYTPPGSTAAAAAVAAAAGGGRRRGRAASGQGGGRAVQATFTPRSVQALNRNDGDGDMG
jgi:hypothetical protein